MAYVCTVSPKIHPSNRQIHAYMLAVLCTHYHSRMKLENLIEDFQEHTGNHNGFTYPPPYVNGVGIGVDLLVCQRRASCYRQRKGQHDHLEHVIAEPDPAQVRRLRDMSVYIVCIVNIVVHM